MSVEGGPPIMEEMAAFFDARAAGYDDHMRSSLGDRFEGFYGAVSLQIPEGDHPLAVLDLGAGTGAEIAGIMGRAPRALFTCVDMSAGMLEKLCERFADHRDQLTLICGSYLEVPFPPGAFDVAVAVMTMHHFTHEVKRDLYARIREALRPGGTYVEGDWYVTPAQEAEYLEQRAALAPDERCLYHIDIPFALETQRRLLLEAGFAEVSVAWESGGDAVLTAR